MSVWPCGCEMRPAAYDQLLVDVGKHASGQDCGYSRINPTSCLHITLHAWSMVCFSKEAVCQRLQLHWWTNVGIACRDLSPGRMGAYSHYGYQLSERARPDMTRQRAYAKNDKRAGATLLFACEKICEGTKPDSPNRGVKPWTFK